MEVSTFSIIEMRYYVYCMTDSRSVHMYIFDYTDSVSYCTCRPGGLKMGSVMDNDLPEQ